MRLKQIKLAGFKSFVDATKIPFLNALSAIIGPNGCGKSNVIDAVRWVLGESSAKHLRGDSMMDVIFNGSTARRPVSVASVELLFENNHGRLGGEYASYNEISVKRQVSRDGDSAYFLNGQKCRRKDITELFMGTGLGARSYAIIGQGTISRLIESKPQELRVFIEEAAGISRYKERRRDTENRIRHTRENLERLGDIRSELTNQLEKLAAQAKAAKKYRELKQEERRCHSELLIVRYQDLMSQLTILSSQITEQELQLAKVQSAHDKDALELTDLQEKLEELSDVEHRERGIYYEANTQIAALEQQLQAAELRQTQTREALTELTNKISVLDRRLAGNADEAVQLTQESQEVERHVSLLQVSVEQGQEAFQRVRQQDKSARRQLDEQIKLTTEVRHDVSLLRKQLEHVSSTKARLESQYVSDETALKEIQVRDNLALASDSASVKNSPNNDLLNSKDFDSLTSLSSKLDELNQDKSLLAERQLALDEELEANQDSLVLARTGLQNSLQERAGAVARADVLDQLLSSANEEGDQLWQHLKVSKGWEQASQLALGTAIHFPVAVLDAYDPNMRDEETQLEIGFRELPSKESQIGTIVGSSNEVVPVSSSLNIAPWLKGVHWTQDIMSAEALLPTIAPDERIVTADGFLLGHGFKLTQLATEPSLLAFNEERQQLSLELTNLDNKVNQQQVEQGKFEEACNQLSAAIRLSRQERTQIEEAYAQINQAITRRQHQAALTQQKVADLTRRIESTQQEIVQISSNKAEALSLLEGKQTLLDNAIAQESKLKNAVSHQVKRTADAQVELDKEKQALEVLKSQQAPLATKIALNQQSKHQLNSDAKECHRQKTQLESDSNAQGDSHLLRNGLSNQSLQEALDKQLGLRLNKQNKLEDIRKQQARLQEQVDTLGVNKKQHLAKTEALNQNSSNLKLRREGLKGQADSQRLVLQEEGVELALLTDETVSVKSESERQAELDKIRRGIARLGAINLAAIEEYEQQSERKQYLDEQDEDLNKALYSLEDAIRKIDKETRSRFKQTFDQVNHDLGLLFPKVFGGGSAYLAMTDDDLLDTGVTIMARPPGKKNSTIHLLSGGEKALTALSLVFAIFRLNPAPFCMLDEVDAPLDDANVERFCRLLKEMSQSVQFIYISHNKITMEMADQLIGVTMHEPGVSRIVAVDIDEAVALADAG